MTMTIKGFRTEAARRRQGRRRGARRYPAELRDFAVAHALAVKAAGGSVYAAAGELGVSEVTLGNWLRKSSGHGKLREVRVMPRPKPRQQLSEEGLSITTAGGHVVSGLTVEQAAQLLRAIS